MNYCVDFALANRKLMLIRVQEVLLDYFPNLNFGETINIVTIMQHGKIILVKM